MTHTHTCTHTHTHTHTHGTTPLDDGSARRKDLYPTIHNMHKRHPCPRRDSNPQSQEGSDHSLRPRNQQDWLLKFRSSYCSWEGIVSLILYHLYCITYTLYLTLVHYTYHVCFFFINPLNTELNPICQ